LLLLEDPDLTVTVPSPAGALQIIGLRSCSPRSAVHDDSTVITEAVLNEIEDTYHPLVIERVGRIDEYEGVRAGVSLEESFSVCIHNIAPEADRRDVVGQDPDRSAAALHEHGGFGPSAECFEAERAAPCEKVEHVTSGQVPVER
jgi:hypothetical protein